MNKIKVAVVISSPSDRASFEVYTIEMWHAFGALLEYRSPATPPDESRTAVEKREAV